MRYEARPPRIELDAFVKCLWRLRGAPWEIEPQPIVPDGCFELIVHLGEPFVEREVYSPAAAAGPTEPLPPRWWESTGSRWRASPPPPASRCVNLNACSNRAPV